MKAVIFAALAALAAQVGAFGAHKALLCARTPWAALVTRGSRDRSGNPAARSLQAVLAGKKEYQYAPAGYHAAPVQYHPTPVAPGGANARTPPDHPSAPPACCRTVVVSHVQRIRGPVIRARAWAAPLASPG
jgi:hypothetical protein